MPPPPFLLHVEDNPDDVELTRLTFKAERFPHELVVMEDGARALDFLFGAGEFAGRDVGDAPALILLDLNLPKVGGLEVLRRVKAEPRFARVPVVVLTSSFEDGDRARAAALGADLYIQKPVEFAAFGAVAAQVARLLESRRSP